MSAWRPVLGGGPLRALLRAFGCAGYHDIDVSDGRVRRKGPNANLPENAASIDELLDRAVAAINRGDRAAASALAEQVLASDEGNADAEDLLAAPGGDCEIRRLTLLFVDLVDSTVLSTRVEPETYRNLVKRIRQGRCGDRRGFPRCHAQDAESLVRSRGNSVPAA